MQRSIFLLALVLAVSLTVGNVALAQADPSMQEAETLAANGDIKGAMDRYLEATQRHPDSNEAFARLGGMQLLDQRYSDAVKSFQQAITLGDEGARSFIGMGMAYLHIGQLGPARAAFVEAKARGGDDLTDVDHVLSWIDTRSPDAYKGH
jgi:Flp pilus assembly protein TadD